MDKFKPLLRWFFITLNKVNKLVLDCKLYQWYSIMDEVAGKSVTDKTTNQIRVYYECI